MTYPVINADELREVAELVDVLFPDDDASFSRMVELLIGENPHSLGYSTYILKCRECGHQQLTIAPVPAQFPMECYKCGEMTAYIFKTAEEAP